MAEAAARHPDKRIELWFEDEARVGNKAGSASAGGRGANARRASTNSATGGPASPPPFSTFPPRPHRGLEGHLQLPPTLLGARWLDPGRLRRPTETRPEGCMTAGPDIGSGPLGPKAYFRKDHFSEGRLARRRLASSRRTLRSAACLRHGGTVAIASKSTARRRWSAPSTPKVAAAFGRLCLASCPAGLPSEH
jgi:hypothetical protein